MLNISKFALILIIQLICTIAWSQEADIFNGYYISTSGDTIFGQFYQGQIHANKLKFKNASEPGWHLLLPRDVRSVIGESNIYYITYTPVVGSNNSPLFIRELIHGKYCLFEGFPEINTVYYFINSTSIPKLVRVNPRAYKDQFKSYFGEPAEPYLDHVRYNRRGLMNFISRMNGGDPSNVQSVTSGKKDKKYQYFNIGLSVGSFYLPAPKYTYVSDGFIKNAKFNTAFRPALGLFARLNLNQNFGINLGVYYLNKDLLSDSLVTLISRVYHPINPNTGELIQAVVKFYYKHDFYLKFRQLEIPLGMHIKLFPYQTYNPILSLGINFYTPLVSKAKRDWGSPYKLYSPGYLNPPPPLSDGLWKPIEFFYKRKAVGYYIGVGFAHKMNKKNSIELNIQYATNRERLYYYLEGIYLDRAYDSYSVHAFDFTWKRFQMSIVYHFGLK